MVKMIKRILRNMNTVNKYNKQRGSSTVQMLIGASAIGASAVAYVPYAQQQNFTRLVDAANSDIQAIQQSIYSYHIENRAFPSDLQTLISTGYYHGASQSPWGTDYNLAVNGDATAITVNYESPSEKVAQRVAQNFGQGQATGSRVNVSMGRPSREAILNTFLHRTAQADCPECNTMETSINMANNDIRNVGTAYVERIDADEVHIDSFTTNTLKVNDSAQVGAAYIRSVGVNGLAFEAGVASFNGSLSVGGDLVSNGGLFNGFSAISTTNLSAQDIISTTLDADLLTAGNADINSATITNLTADSATFNQANFQSLDAVSLTADSANIRALESTSLSFNSADFNTLSAQNITSSQANIGSLSGSTLNYGRGTFGDVSTSNMTATTATISNLSGTQINYQSGEFSTLNSDQINAQQADITTLTGSQINYDQGSFSNTSADSGTFDDLTMTGLYAVTLDVTGNMSASNMTADTATATNANFARVEAGTLEANTGRFGQLDATNVTFNDLNVSGTLRTNTLNVNNTTTTNQLVASNSNLGTTTGTSLSVSGNISAASLNATSGSFGTVSFGSGTGGSLNLTGGIDAGSGVFTNVNATTATTNNATSSKSSINDNHDLIQSYIAAWNQCKAAGGCQ